MNKKPPTLTLVSGDLVFAVTQSNQTISKSQGDIEILYKVDVTNKRGGQEFSIDRLSKPALSTLYQAIELYLGLID
jgi:hypothetical protein